MNSIIAELVDSPHQVARGKIRNTSCIDVNTTPLYHTCVQRLITSERDNRLVRR